MIIDNVADKKDNEAHSNRNDDNNDTESVKTVADTTIVSTNIAYDKNDCMDDKHVAELVISDSLADDLRVHETKGKEANVIEQAGARNH